MVHPEYGFVIDDNYQVNSHGNEFARGLIPRDYGMVPVGFYSAAPSLSIPLIPRDQWVDRIRARDAAKARVQHIRRRGNGGQPIPSLDQNGQGYCWAYSLTMTIMLVRAIMNQPYKRLSGHMIGCLVKNYRDEGGWCGLSLEFAMKNGVADVDHWKEKSMSRSNDTQAMRDNAKLHMPTDAWADMAAAVYDRNLTDDQSMTLLLSGVPHQEDFNWWGHSVCIMDAIIVSSDKGMLATDLGSLDLNNPKDAAVMGAVFGKLGINSWTDGWGDVGEFTLTGSKFHCDGGVAPLIVGAN